jgi:hypothetical protein
MNYHAYKNGYSTLPNLRKIQKEEVFEKNNFDSELIQTEKFDALKNQRYFFEYNINPLFYDISANFILENYPSSLKSKNYLDIVKETNEDFLIHRIDGDKDYLCSAHVCFASHWLPEEKIGLSFEDIHKPVPMNLKNSKKLIHAAVYGGIFERFVWSVIYENKYNFHPRFEDKKFDINNPIVLVKVERQVTVGFPENHFCLFILRQYLIQENEIDKELLAKAIENMTEEQRKYKGLLNCENLIKYLKE